MSSGKADRYLTQPRDSNTLTQTCSSNIQKITQNTAKIKSMVNQLGTGQDTSELRDSLQQIQHFTNQLAKETNKHLKDLSFVSPSSEQRPQKIQKDRLMNEFSAALDNFQAVQRQAAQKEKESVTRARAGSSLSAEDGVSEEQLVSFDNQDDWAQTITQTTEEDLALIKERETNIRKLECIVLCPCGQRAGLYNVQQGATPLATPPPHPPTKLHFDPERNPDFRIQAAPGDQTNAYVHHVA
uniref:syntaxin-12-like isoform X2 n=1 Tax=Oncorhynchus gorbuscha TaxID=8017 RepID=UPI001EAE8BBC|nr:syntaxin-12-like isoform X2 [Oncorhynchus gorbuscha]